MEDSKSVFQKIVSNVEQVIIGKRYQIEMLMMALLCEGHVLLEDVPGVGKTTLVESLAASVQGKFNRIQFTPDVMPSDVMGFSMYNKKTDAFVYKEGAVICNFLLADEINRTSAKTQSSLLEAMQERQVTVDGVTHPLPDPFMVIATQNPVEHLGTYPLPEAQLDRFLMKLSIGYPSKRDECRILSSRSRDSDKLAPVASLEDILLTREQLKRIYTDQKVLDYIVSLIRATRTHTAVALGASPRACVALHHAARANAFRCGRDFVTPDDVKLMTGPVLAHRLVLKREAALKKQTVMDVIYELLTALPAQEAEKP